MNLADAFEIVNAISENSDPYTDGNASRNAPENSPLTVRALCVAVAALQERLAELDPSMAIGRTGAIGTDGLGKFVDATEKELILEALEKTRYNKTAAARLLGISFGSLRHKISKHGIE